jgi:hypothetical protein
MPAQNPKSPGPGDLSDEELDRYIRVRLTLAGVDISVLPESDPGAPADQARILRSARSFLRGTGPAISALPLDPEEFPPVLYPAALPEIREGEGEG